MSELKNEQLFTKYSLLSYFKFIHTSLRNEILDTSMTILREYQHSSIVNDLLQNNLITIPSFREQELAKIISHEVPVQIDGVENTGSKIIYELPYNGDSRLFQAYTNKGLLNPCEGIINHRSLLVSYETAEDHPDPNMFRESFDKNLASIKQNLFVIYEAVMKFNNELPDFIQSEIEFTLEESDDDYPAMAG